MVNTVRVKCPRCGYLNDFDNHFCDYCGYNLLGNYNDINQTDEQTESELYGSSIVASRGARDTTKAAAASHPQVDLDSKLDKHRLVKRTFKIGGVLLGIAAIGGGYSYGQHYYSKAVTLNRLIKATANGKNHQAFISDRLQHPDRVAAKYFRVQPTAFKQFQNEMKTHSRTTNGWFTYQKTGSHFGIFPKYQVQIHNAEIADYPYSIKITTRPSATILLNNKRVGTADAHGQYVISHLNTDSAMVSANYKVADGKVQTKPLKVTPQDRKQPLTLIDKQAERHLKLQSQFSPQLAQTLLDQIYQQVQKVTSQGRPNDDLKRFFLNGEQNYYYHNINQLALSFYQPDAVVTYKPTLINFHQLDAQKNLVNYKLKYTFKIGNYVHEQTFVMTGQFQKEANKYKLVSVISGGTPISDRSYYQ